MTILEELSWRVGDAFAEAGLEPHLGRVKPADRPDLAQFQCNGALAAAKAAKQNPRALAEKVCETLRREAAFKDVSIAGPGFINLTLTDDDLARRLGDIIEDDSLGGWQTPVPTKILLDYGGRNVAKPPHVGHLRARIIRETP
ncbi:Arginyl-tRNA synthetase [hydrothermal vent metagenome]|uniref:Arginyl-tRNA synthetase n=1 Tax=hydrothermal vent metagenome TaxID=652676 RepID=A0A3B0S313_9ZZZZ